jgi:hypothetical protein
MSPVMTTSPARRSRPRLRLLRGERPPRAQSDETTGLGSAGALQGSSVLVAGADGQARIEMLHQLRGLLPEDTAFVEARETWEVVARAPGSRMVVLTGDLADLSARGLMRVLSRRHPLLPVIALGSAGSGSARAPRLGAASL